MAGQAKKDFVMELALGVAGMAGVVVEGETDGLAAVAWQA